jgi:hypothetical protein
MTEAFFRYLKEDCQALFPTDLGNGQYKAIVKFLFTFAIVKGTIGNRTNYDDRWCYSELDKAFLAFVAWDGTGEPEGWHRHPATGRRRDETGEEYINF